MVLLVCALLTGTAAVLVGERWGNPAPGAVGAVESPPLARDATHARGAASSPRRGREAAAARRVLVRWDAQRAEAYAGGSVPALSRLYVPGSTAGRRDVALLRGYLRRGYRVAGMRTQVLALRVVDRTPGRCVLLVTDRLQAAVAVRRGLRANLPADAASTRQVTFVRGASRWRVSAVSDAG